MKNNIDHIIDKKIQEVMGDFEVPYQSSHWEKMADKMTQIEMQETSFDESMRSRLTNVEKKFDPNHWTAMATQLDMLDAEDTAFDNTVRERVEHTQMPYRSSHWEMMNKQLDEHFTLKGKIVRYKIVELSLMLLALFTAYNLLETDVKYYEKGVDIPLIKTEQSINPSKVREPKSFNKGYDWRKQNNYQKPKKQNPNQSIVSTQTIDNQYVVNSIPENYSKNYSENGITNDLSKNPLQAYQNEQNVINNERSGLPNVTNTEGVDAIVAIVKNDAIGSEKPSNTEGVATAKEAVAALSTKALNELTITSETPLANLDLNATVSNLKNANSADVAEAVNALRPKALSISSLYQAIEMPKTKKNQWWRFGLFGTSSSDIAETDYTVNDVLKGATNIAAGNKGFGFSVGFKKGRFEIESGLSFKNKEYVPAKFKITTGNFSNYTTVVTPDLVKLSLVSIPLNFNYSFVQTDHINFYASLGASTNLVSKLNAIYPEEIDIEDLKLKLAKANADLQNSNNPSYFKEIDVAIYSKGMFDDFKFKENYYFTAQASLGLEYKMTPLASLFLQTGYEQHLLQAGIGTRNDRINSFNLQAGAKMSFGKTKF
jgi:hypothetical protein